MNFAKNYKIPLLLLSILCVLSVYRSIFSKTEILICLFKKLWRLTHGKKCDKVPFLRAFCF